MCRANGPGGTSGKESRPTMRLYTLIPFAAADVIKSKFDGQGQCHPA
jgi:hypothetical protein